MLVEAVRAAHASGSRLVAICTGAFVLARAGLLDGRAATTHWRYLGALAEAAPRATIDTDALYVDEGEILTSAGNAAGIDLCLHVVHRDLGAAVANAVARLLVMAPHRPGGQRQFTESSPVREAEGGLGDVIAWAQEQLHRPVAVSELAEKARLSTRQLTRQFVAETGMTPLVWLSEQRVRRAQELLETTRDTVQSVASRSGHGTAASLRRRFREYVGVSPDEYRRTFGRAP